MRAAITILLRLGLGALFVFTGVSKLRDPVAFAGEVANYEFLPSLAGSVAATLPMIEVVLGAALIVATAPWRRAAALATFGLLALFTVAMAQAVARHINIDCGCFTGSGPVSVWTLLRDVVLLGAAAALYALTPLGRRRESPA